MSTIEAPALTVAEQLHRVADWIDMAGPFPDGAGVMFGPDPDQVDLFPRDADQLLFLRRLVGNVEKVKGSALRPLLLRATVDGCVRVTIWPPEGTCRQVETGDVEEVEVERVVTPAVTETVVEYRPVTEWDCGPVLSGATSGEVA